jgi:hypothetical protein
MNIVVKLSTAASLVMTLATPALAAVNINYPANKSDVESTFKLSASSSSCSSKDVAVMGYSLDGSSDNTFVEGTSLETTITASAGTHTVHVKSWTSDGSVCVSEVSVNVAASTDTLVPSNAIVDSSLEALPNWRAEHDTGGKGSASGSTKLVTSPSIKGASRLFTSSFKGSGDERFSLDFGDDATSTNFLYDTWIYLNSSVQKISNIELDMNQVLANGKTVIYGFQCDGWDGKWDYAGNTHGSAHPNTGWIHTGLSCNPRSWKINTWHHVQVSYSRNSSGDVTYSYVIFDGAKQDINRTVFSAYSLGWAHGRLITNFQVDGFGASGSNTVYADQLTISRW